MSLWRRWRFAGWLWLLWPALLGLGFASLTIVVAESRAQNQQRRDSALALVPLIAQAAAAHVDAGDRDALGRLARQLIRSYPVLEEVEIRGALGEQLAYEHGAASPDPGLLGQLLSLIDDKPDLLMTLEASPKAVTQLGSPALPSVHLVLRPTSSDQRMLQRLRRFLACVLVGLVLAATAAIAGIQRLAQWQRPLLDAARHLGQGRLEVRAPVAAAGLTGELGEAINQIGRQLLEAQDRYRGWMEQETGRLRRELNDERARLRSLERSVEQTESSARTKSELYAQISHELRTPLAAIIGYSDLLRKASLAGPVAEQVETLSKTAHGMLVMVNDLLDWSRIEAGHLQLNESPFDLEDCVEDVVALLAPLAYDKGLELVHIIYHDVPRRLVGDAQRIKQVLTNLLSNAIKFTERGEVVLRVLKEREEPRHLTLLLRISDTGVGLAPEQQRQLFQPYRQLGTKPGSGLGLVVTRKLTELMGGSVSVESSPGQGATFSASLSLGRQAEQPHAPVYDDLRGSRVWICEPHTTARLALLHSLEYWGMEVRELGSAAELHAAVQRSAAARPDLVVLGLSAADAEQQAQGASPPLLPELRRLAIPALCLVASASQNLHEALRRAGAARCLPKAAGRDTLYEALRELVSGQTVSPAQLQGLQVLVADNNVANRRYVVALLQGLGAGTSEAGDGREAVERWAQTRPDAMLLDVHMPVMDGIAAAREIRAREGGGKRSLIVGISAYLDPSERRALALAGMDGDLIKPFDERQLLRLFARRTQPEARTAAHAAKVTERLSQDREMRALLRQELPLQLRELEDAYAAGNMQRLRDAAHQVHGTAAFYRLAILKQAASALESRIAQASGIDADAGLRDAVRALRDAVMATLEQISDGQPATSELEQTK